MASSFARPIEIMMIERDSAMVELARSSLELAGLPAEVHAFGARDAALGALANGGQDVLLVDLELVGSGFLDRLRAASAPRKLPLIALSATPDDAADYVFPRPRDEGDFMGIVAAIKFFWMNEAPSLPPPPPPAAPSLPSVPPRRLSHIDLMTLPIEPAEAYLLSILDGAMGVDELCSVLGSPPAQARKMLRRLSDLGAVSWQAPHPRLPPPPPPVAISSPSWPAVPSTPPPAEPAAPPSEPAPAAEPAVEASGARFTAERKRQIDDAYALADEADHYELLGVPRDATRKDIREAYFALAKLFHTDTLYGVELGDYRHKMDRVFHAITEAYDVLGKSKRRREYDEYLGALRETAGLDEATPPEPEPPPEPAAPPASASSQKPRRTRSETMRAIADHRLRDLRANRRNAAPPPAAPADKPDPLRSLSRALTQVSRSSGRLDRADRLIADARDAEKKGNFAGAAEALRIAVAWRPDDETLKADAERLRWQAVRSKAEAFEKRARYAQERMRWEEAAKCWAKVADARPNEAEPQEHAANAALRANELPLAARYAKRAVELRPDAASGHRLLGMSFAAANKPASAKRALEKALSLDPKDVEARQQLEQLDA